MRPGTTKLDINRTKHPGREGRHRAQTREANRAKERARRSHNRRVRGR